MPTNYMPNRDADLDAWMQNFADKITATPTAYGLVAGDATIIQAQADAFTAALLAATDPSTRTSATIATKDATRATAEDVLRGYAQRVNINPAVSNAERVDLGLTVRSTTPTPIPAPTTAPALMLINASPLLARLNYRDSDTPLLKRKPDGVIGLELYRSIGTVAAVDPAQAEYLATVTKTPFAVSYVAGDVGKVATYFGRWVTRSGPAGVAQKGPWSAALAVSVI